MTWHKCEGEDKGQIKATINEAIIDTRSALNRELDRGGGES